MENKQRHGCLTAWLIMMMIANASVAFLYILSDPNQVPNSPIAMNPMTMLLQGIISLFNLAFAFGLWYWKKWAFIGFSLTAVLMFLTNINMGIDIVSAALGLIGIALLYLVLQIKRDGKSGWEQLE